MVKNALEPYWETKFEGSSYGFRPGRGCHDAIAAIYNSARGHARSRRKYVLDADIKGAFDNISHAYLLKTIGNFPARALVKQWLKAGYVEFGELHLVDSGPPQGGVISPLLANVALHGMEEALGVKRVYIKHRDVFEVQSRRALVRYADDFVVFTETEADAEACQRILTRWLAARGLQFSEAKTQTVSLKDGFNFLGLNVRRYEVKDRRSNLKLLIKPSQESVQQYMDNLKAEWKKVLGHDVGRVIKVLNPKIRGWGNYFRIGVSAEVFDSLDRWMLGRCLRWARRTHRTKSLKWLRRKYFNVGFEHGNKSWRLLRDKEHGGKLLEISSIKIQRHVMVKGTHSPDNPALSDYWKTRRSKEIKALPKGKRTLAMRQQGKCPRCGDWLLNKEELHVHHKVPRSEGGSDQYDNLELVHLYCHQQVHSKKA